MIYDAHNQASYKLIELEFFDPYLGECNIFPIWKVF